jgi:hypothetical protein
MGFLSVREPSVGLSDPVWRLRERGSDRWEARSNQGT